MILKYLTDKVMELTRALNARGPAEQLSVSDYALEMLAETGEFGDAIKKYRRMKLGFPRMRNPLSEEAGRQKMEDEAGDAFMSFLRVCHVMDIDPLRALANKYNRLVQEEGVDTMPMLDAEALINLKLIDEAFRVGGRRESDAQA